MKKATFEELETCLSYFVNDRLDFKSDQEVDELSVIMSEMINAFGWTEEEYFNALVSDRALN